MLSEYSYVVGTNIGYLDMFDLVSGKLLTFLSFNIYSQDPLKKLRENTRDSLSLAFDTNFSPGSAIINPEYKSTSDTMLLDRTVNVDFWFTLFEMEKPAQQTFSIIPEIVFKFYRHSETETSRSEFPLQFAPSSQTAPPGRFYYHVYIPIKIKNSDPTQYKMHNLWNGEKPFPTAEAQLTEQVLLSKQWYYFRVSLVRYYEQKSYFLQVMVFSPTNPNKLVLYLDRYISGLIPTMAVDFDKVLGATFHIQGWPKQ